MDSAIFVFAELTDEITKCCSACFNRIARRLGNNPQTNEPLVALVPENADGMLFTGLKVTLISLILILILFLILDSIVLIRDLSA